MASGSERKPLLWVGSSREDLREFPEEVRWIMGFALHLAQIGQKHVDAKPLRGFGGASVLEVVEDHVGDTFRGVYTVQFKGAVYVLHAFQKKSKTGIKTAKRDSELIRERLKRAEEHYERWHKDKK
jgi:phage-related protein